MAPEEEWAEEGGREDSTASPAASTSQVPQGVLLDDFKDNICPICQDSISNEARVKSCGHRYCFPCIREWSCRKAICPLCRRPFNHLLHKLGPHSYELHDVTLYKRERAQNHSAESRQQGSSGLQPHRATSGDHTGSHARVPERDQSRSPRQHSNDHDRASERGRSRAPRLHNDGHSRALGNDQSRSTRHRHHGHTRGPERDQSRSPRRHSNDHDRALERGRSRAPRPHNDGHNRAAGRDQRRSTRHHHHGHTRAPERDQIRPLRRHSYDHDRAPVRGESRSLRNHHDALSWAPRSQSYSSSVSRRWQQSGLWDTAHYRGQTLRPEQDVAASFRRGEHHQPAGWDNSREQHGRRSQSWDRSQARWERSWGHHIRRYSWSRDREGPRDSERRWNRSSRQGWESYMEHSGTGTYSSPARQRWRSRHPDEGRARSSEQDIPSSSRR
ncbi:serine/arginine repetitive matrix protein 5-like [Heliangelus exortis]|uniref:serine/arginine repetitive matrix protein 5-like n=1 Tax=Heliangelus exortis TaxID=472823 RepID=UPI003A8F81C8